MGVTSDDATTYDDIVMTRPWSISERQCDDVRNYTQCLVLRDYNELCRARNLKPPVRDDEIPTKTIDVDLYYGGIPEEAPEKQ